MIGENLDSVLPDFSRCQGERGRRRSEDCGIICAGVWRGPAVSENCRAAASFPQNEEEFCF